MLYTEKSIKKTCKTRKIVYSSFTSIGKIHIRLNFIKTVFIKKRPIKGLLKFIYLLSITNTIFSFIIDNILNTKIIRMDTILSTKIIRMDTILSTKIIGIEMLII